MTDHLSLLHAISETYFDYAETVDAADLAAFAALFTDDCRFDGGEPVSGRDVIERRARRLLSQFTETSHHISNIRIRSVENDAVHATAYVYAWHRKLDGEIFAAAGQYESTFRFDEDRWRFAAHAILLAGTMGTDGRTYLRRPRADLSLSSAIARTTRPRGLAGPGDEPQAVRR